MQLVLWLPPPPTPPPPLSMLPPFQYIDTCGFWLGALPQPMRTKVKHFWNRKWNKTASVYACMSDNAVSVHESQHWYCVWAASETIYVTVWHSRTATTALTMPSAAGVLFADLISASYCLLFSLAQGCPIQLQQSWYLLFAGFLSAPLHHLCRMAMNIF